MPDVSRPVIVALSGGADSVALLSVLTELGYECVAAHCNFHLRGEESNRDMRLCHDLCSRLGVDLYVHDFDVESRRKATGESVEMACRSLRYEWFDRLLDSLRAQAIAVAHHREDNEETFLLNLLRGSSIRGLTGMRPRNGFVVRPMLEASRPMIEDYLRLKELPFVVDSSNLTNGYLRNRLRHIVLPAMRQAKPDADRGLLASIDYLTLNREFYSRAMNRTISLYLNSDRIDLKRLLASEPDSRLILFEMLSPMGFNMSQVDDILGSADRSGLQFASKTHRLELSHGTLQIIPLSALAAPAGSEVQVTLRRDILTPVHITITDHHITEFHPRRDPDTAYFDATILEGDHTFTIRPWRRGDRIKPFGLSGSRLVSDVLRDARLSAAQKRDIRLLTCDDKVLWIIGLRQSSHFSISPATKRYIKLQINPRMLN